MGIVQEIKCSHCGAPIAFEPGEILATCKYCGYTVVIETGQSFTFEHSLLLNRYDQTQIEDTARGWMRDGFLKPGDLERKAKLLGKELIYLPFWIVSLEARSKYKGVFERITPAITKDGVIEKQYDWIILARKATEFPVREYEVPIEGKIPYDFRRIESFAKVLNSEIDKNDAEEQARSEVEDNHRFLAQQDVDKMIEFKTDTNVKQSIYLHAPIWFLKYEYKGKPYQLIIDGATGAIVKGDIPSKGFGLL